MTLSWSFGGTALSTFGRVTLIDSYLDFADRRGKNQVIPYRHGAVFVEKYFDERVMTFGIAIRAANAGALETTMDTLRALLAPRTQQVLSCTREDASVRTALASVNKSYDPTRRGSKTALIVVEFDLADPFFRGATLIDVTEVISASPTSMDVTNTGTVEERDPVITLTGPLENVDIINTTNGATLTYTGIIAGGEVVVIQTVNGEYTAVMDGVTNVIGNISHSGGTALMVFDVGLNQLDIDSDVATTGEVQISFYPPYL